MATQGAPAAYLRINAGALLLAGAIIFGPVPSLDRRDRLIAGAVLIVIFALPLLTGPSINGIARWLPLGPFILHAGMLTIPSLLALAAHEEKLAPPVIAAALLIALAQPDFANAFALTGGAIGIYQVRSDWRVGLIVTVGFFVAVAAALQGELPAALQGELPAAPFVERIIITALRDAPAMAALLALSLGGAVAVMLFGTGLPRIARYPIGMSLVGFVLASMISNYPTPLAGYGAAAIIGYALAHAVAFALPTKQEADT